ncbi:MAG TPA: DUF6455 family protein [Burkholderiales bacterium]|nr:DUF6455 family protein [Burkholderiales bacterium]
MLLAAAASPPLFAAWACATGREGELEIWRVMRRRGLAVDEAATDPAPIARAIRRCQLCPSLDQCRAWLARGHCQGTDEFCPNDGFFRSLDSAQHR